MPLRAIIFDFDGVLANSEPLHLQAYQDVLSDIGVTLSADDYYARYLGYDDVGAFSTIAADRRLSWDTETIDRLVTRKAERLEALERDTSVLFPGAADALRRAAASVPVAIASGALGAEIRRVLDRERLQPLVAAIVSAEDTAVSKPDPAPYREAVARLARGAAPGLLPAECVALEDSLWGLQSARAAGLRTIGVAHTYRRAALSSSADSLLDRIAELDLYAVAQLCA